MNTGQRTLLLVSCLLLMVEPLHAQFRKAVALRGARYYGYRTPSAPQATAPNLTITGSLRSFSGHLAAVRSVVYTPGGRFLLTAGYDNKIRVWGLASGKELRCLTGHTGPIISIAVTPDGRHVVSGSFDKTVRLWDLDSGRSLRVYKGYDREVHHVAVSPDGRTLASASYDQTVRLWDVATGKEARRLTGHHASVLVVTFSPDGKTLASGGEDHAIRLWNATTGAQLQQLTGHTDSVLGLAFSPDGRQLASASHDQTVRLWDVGTGKQECQLTGVSQAYGNLIDKRVRGVAFSPDGATLASVGMDRTIHLWEIATKRECVQFAGHGNTIWEVAFSPDGRTLATAGEDQRVEVWDATCGHSTPSTAPLSDAQLAALWKDLESPDAAQAYHAVWALVAAPRQALPLLDEGLHLATQPFTAEPAHIALLIARLDDDDGAMRERATDELARIGQAAESALHRAVASSNSAEVCMRARLVLDRLHGVVWAPDALQRLRAVQVLEQIGTPRALEILQRLAQGRQNNVGAEAAAAVRRLGKRTS